MADLMIDRAIDLFMSTIEAVPPRTLSSITFKRHRAPTPLKDAPGAVRYFEIDIPSLLGNDVWPARSDGDSVWYATDQFLIKFWYPPDWDIVGDSTQRGVPWIKIQDAIDLNKALCYNDFLASLGADSYTSPQFKGAYVEDKLWVLRYTFSWLESLSV